MLLVHNALDTISNKMRALNWNAPTTRNAAARKDDSKLLIATYTLYHYVAAEVCVYNIN